LPATPTDKRLREIATTPGSVLSPKGRRLTRVMRVGTANDFVFMGQRMSQPVLVKQMIAVRDPYPDDVGVEIRPMLEATIAPIIEPPIKAHFEPFVEFESDLVARANIVAGHDLLRSQGIEFAEALPALGVIADLPIPPDILDWAREFAATRVTKMDETTQRRLARVIADALLEEQRAVPQVAAAIQSTFADMSLARAVNIAWTEVADAMSEGAFRQANEIGSQRKEWLTVGDDRVSQDICAPNEAQGEIPINQNFGSGHAHPTGHPQCRCVVIYSGATRAVIGPRG